MRCSIRTLILLGALLSAASAQPGSSEHAGFQATFKAHEWTCDRTEYTDWNARDTILTRYCAPRLQ